MSGSFLSSLQRVRGDPVLEEVVMGEEWMFQDVILSLRLIKAQIFSIHM